MIESKSRKIIGDRGEELAVDLLLKNGYEIIERNYRYGHGEIDIIAKTKNILVFVEVKTRKNLEFGSPLLAITKKKQHQIKKIAEAYIYEKISSEIDCRIDVIAILIKKNLPPEINHIENAF